LDAQGGAGCVGEVAFGFDVDKAVEYVKGCQTYEGGFALCPGAEAHGGSTYCAVCFLFLFLEARGGSTYCAVCCPSSLSLSSSLP